MQRQRGYSIRRQPDGYLPEPFQAPASAGYCRQPLARSGQAMIESMIVMLVICLLFFGLFQLAHGFAHREILRHAAARAARARTVGFNHWMCTKVMRAATIPNAGRMLQPQETFVDATLREAIDTLSPGALWDWALATTPDNSRAAFERARIPDYLASENSARASYILDYEGWDDIRGSGLGGGAGGTIGNQLEIRLEQKYPLSIMVRGLYDWVGALTPALESGELTLRGNYEIEGHYQLYLDDRGL